MTPKEIRAIAEKLKYSIEGERLECLNNPSFLEEYGQSIAELSSLVEYVLATVHDDDGSTERATLQPRRTTRTKKASKGTTDMPRLRFIWGSLLLVLAMVVSLIGLIDLGVFLLLGSGSTLSQHIADSVPKTAGAFLLTNGLSFVAGMLATHFTSFRMTPRESDERPPNH